MKNSLILIFLFILFFSGCNGNHCIKVGGNYEGVQGDFEYCWGSSDEMKNFQAPIVNSKSEKFIGISEKEASIILAKIEIKPEEEDNSDSEGKKFSYIKAKESAFIRLKNFLKK